MLKTHRLMSHLQRAFESDTSNEIKIGQVYLFNLTLAPFRIQNLTLIIDQHFFYIVCQWE